MSNFIYGELFNFRQLFWLDKFIMPHKGFIAGGCFKNILTDNKIKDIDIFFRTIDDYLEAIDVYKAKIKKDPKNWSFSYKNDKVWAVNSLKDDIRLELIKTSFGEPSEVIDNFDFTITKFAYFIDEIDSKDEDGKTKKEYKILYHKDYFEHLLMKRLVIDNKLLYPLSSFNRSYKYQKYGFGLCRESKKILVESIHMLPTINTSDLGSSLYDGLD